MAAKIKILLVEDEAYSYMHVQNILEAEGYEVLAYPGKPFIDNYEDAVAVTQTDIPHIAILDIDLGKNKKDGIEIGQFIRDTYYSPVIFLSAHNNDENLRRSGMMRADGFVVKLGKPLELQQLKADIKRLLPLAEIADQIRKEGASFYVKELKGSKDTGMGFRRTRILWTELSFVRTTTMVKNSVVIYLSNGREFLYHTSLTECQAELPPHFLRFSGQEIINAKLFTSQGKSDWVYYIDDKRYEVSEAYRTEKTLAILKGLFL